MIQKLRFSLTAILLLISMFSLVFLVCCVCTLFSGMKEIEQFATEEKEGIEELNQSKVSNIENTDKGDLSDLDVIVSEEEENSDVKDNPSKKEEKSKVNKRLLEEEKTEEYLRPGIDWSSGVLSFEEVDQMMNIASKLYVSKKYKKEVSIIVNVPTEEELSKFDLPVMYYVREGVLILHSSLTIDEKTRVLVSFELKYDYDEVVLIKSEEVA